MKREIGSTGLFVSPVGLGAMPLSIEGRPNEAQALEVVATFVDGGGDFIDTANAYCLDHSDIGHNERLIAKALARIGKNDSVTLATKGGIRRPRGRWECDARPAALRAACEQSLRDLGAEVITLYQLHAPDPAVDFRKSLDALVRLQEEGKIRHIGLSNITAAQLETGLSAAAIASVQNRCNPFFKRDLRNGMSELCGRRRVAYIAHSPVGGHHGHVRLPKHPLFGELSHKYGCSPYCAALAWLLQKGGHIIPIPGSSKVSSVRDSAKAPSVTLEAGDIERIDAIPDE